MRLAPWSDEPSQAPGGHGHAQSQQPGRFWCRMSTEALDSAPRIHKMPRTCPSPLLPTLGEGWLPLGLSPLLEAWVAAGRTGWVLPLLLGVEVATWRAPRVADAAAAHTWSPCCLLPVRPPLPTLAHLPWTGPPSPGPGPCGAPTRTTSRKSGEAQAWAPAARPPLGRWPEGRARGLCRAGPWPPAASDPAWTRLAGLGWLVHSGVQVPPGRARGSKAIVGHHLGCLRCPRFSWGPSFSVRHLCP